MRKRILFMHIAKTAGSAVNAYLRKVLGPEKVLDHVETYQDRFDTFVETDRFREAQVVSGHVTAPALLDLLKVAKTNRAEWTVITVVREPTDHLISHLRWVQNTLRRGDRGLPDSIYRLATDLEATALSDTDQVRHVLEKNRPVSLTLFDNCQTRYFGQVRNYEVRATDVWKSLLLIAENFDHVVNQQALSRMLPRICNECGIPHRNIKVPNENVQPLSGDDRLRSAEVRAAYSDLVRGDRLLLNGLRELPVYSA
jgi:hypothetical protein